MFGKNLFHYKILDELGRGVIFVSPQWRFSCAALEITTHDGGSYTHNPDHSLSSF